MNAYTIIYQPDWYRPEDPTFIAVINADIKYTAIAWLIEALGYQITIVSITERPVTQGIAYLTKPTVV